MTAGLTEENFEVWLLELARDRGAATSPAEAVHADAILIVLSFKIHLRADFDATVRWIDFRKKLNSAKCNAGAAEEECFGKECQHSKTVGGNWKKWAGQMILSPPPK